MQVGLGRKLKIVNETRCEKYNAKYFRCITVCHHYIIRFSYGQWSVFLNQLLIFPEKWLCASLSYLHTSYYTETKLAPMLTDLQAEHFFSAQNSPQVPHGELSSNAER